MRDRFTALKHTPLRRWVVGCCICLFLSICGLAVAQEIGHEIPSWFPARGGAISSGGEYTIDGAMGMSVVGQMAHENGTVLYSSYLRWPMDEADEEVANVYITPAEGTILASDIYTVELRIDNIENLYATDIAIQFDPTIVEIVNADGTVGTQLQHGDFFAHDVVLQNNVNREAGTIQYSTSFQGDKEGIDGSGILAYITMRGLAPGTTPLSITNVLLSDRNSQQIEATQRGAEVTVETLRYSLSGRVLLERRGENNNSGAEVCVETNCVTTGDDGLYTLNDLPRTGTVVVRRPSYLYSQYEYDAEEGVNLEDVTLLGGDINQDDVIDIRDAIRVGQALNSTPSEANWEPLADITDDDNVNLFDMVAVQFNWNKEAPTPWGPSALGGEGTLAPNFPPSPVDENATTQVTVASADATFDEQNGTVDVGITVENVTDLYAFTAILTFDTNKVQVVDVDPNETGIQIQVGDLLDPNHQFVLVNQANNRSGHIELSITQTAPAQAKNGSGTVGTVTFEAVGTGETVIEVASIQLMSNLADSQAMPVQVADGTLPLPERGVTVYLPIIAQ